jgi:hypothetical protein
MVGGEAMGWAILIFTVVVFLAIISPRSRYFMLVVAGIAGAGLYWMLESSKKDAEERQQREALGRTWSQGAIQLEDLRFSGVHLKNRSYGPYMALYGVVANSSKHTLDAQVTLKDCENKTKETNCRVVGQASGTVMPGVPSGQTASFGSSDLQFDNLPTDVQVQCASQPCNAGRVFNWRVTQVRAAHHD